MISVQARIDVFRLLVAVSAACLLGPWNDRASGAGHESASRRGERVPNLELPLVDGRRISLGELRGRVVLIGFWAGWCGPCVESMPRLQQIHQRFAGDRATILGVNLDQNLEDLRNFVADRKIEFPQYWDAESRLYTLFGVRGIPGFVLIDHRGTVIFQRSGADEKTYKRLIRKMEKAVEDAEEVLEVDSGSDSLVGLESGEALARST